MNLRSARSASPALADAHVAWSTVIAMCVLTKRVLLVLVGGFNMF